MVQISCKREDPRVLKMEFYGSPKGETFKIFSTHFSDLACDMTLAICLCVFFMSFGFISLDTIFLKSMQGEG